MASKDALIRSLGSVDGKNYQRYKELAPFYELDGMTLYIDRIQNDPQSASAMRLRVSFAKAGFPDDTHDTELKEIALRDLIARRFWESCRVFAKGGDRGGTISIPRPGQEILERSCVVMSKTFIEVRFTASLPAAGKNAAGRAAVRMIAEDLTEIAKASLFFDSYKGSKLYNHLNTLITSRTIRSSLRERGLAAFVADGSVLPRREDGLAPMIGAVPFTSPEELRTSFVTADGRTVSGMGIPEGLTAVIGATGHGRTVLIDSLSSGVHDHIPGDGRELVITDGDAVAISRDIGRVVKSVDVSMFIADPKRDVRCLSDDSADDALSSAASASEAIEIGCRVLIADDTDVNGGMLYFDRRIAEMIPEGDETLIPISKIARMCSGVSFIIACRHGDIADAADNVIIMSGHTAAGALVRKRDKEEEFRMPAARLPMAKNMDLRKGRKDVHSMPLSSSKIEIGERIITLPYPLKSMERTAAVADAMVTAKEMMDGSLTLKEVAEISEEMFRKRAGSADENIGPDMAAFRKYDIAMVINRHPDIVMAQRK
ncbi:MAG: ABC-ATPase domain-containing protein [Methanomassiliicoccaceae archaeon]|nr:ABC-ATPase domain-containing protein [Methanomassiliicoccaceae archaeon]